MKMIFKPLDKSDLIAPHGKVRVVWGTMNPKNDNYITWFLEGDYENQQEAVGGAESNHQGPYTVHKLFDDTGMELLPPKSF